MKEIKEKQAVATGVAREMVTSDHCPGTCCVRNNEDEAVPMMVHVRPDLYRAFMRCVWMLIHEEGMSPLDAQNTLIEDFLRHHGC